MQARRSASGSEARRASWNSEQVAEGVGRAVRPVEAQRSDTAEGAAAARRDGRGGRGVGLLRAGARGAFFWGAGNWRGFSLWLVGGVFDMGVSSYDVGYGYGCCYDGVYWWGYLMIVIIFIVNEYFCKLYIIL